MRLNDPFNRTRLPATFDRAGRVRLLGEAAKALLRGKLPELDAALWLGGALAGWLANGGDLERDYLEVTAKAGSHHTPAALWRNLQEKPSSRGTTDAEGADTIDPSSSKSESKK